MLKHYLTKNIVLLTGGGSGGHLYPLLAVADALRDETRGSVELVYVGPMSPFEKGFADRRITVHHIAGGKFRRYASIQNLFDIPRLAIGLVQSLAILYSVMPDVVFSKGGSGSFAVVLAARFYRIPVIIHESDAVPGLTNRLSARFAARVAVGFPAAAAYFSRKKVAYVGNPIRPELMKREEFEDQAYSKRQLGFAETDPLILVTGGSQGSTRINRFIIGALPTLLPITQILHQVGAANEGSAREQANEVLEQLPAELKSRYRVQPLLDPETMRRALGAADLVISRAGAGAIYEEAAAGRPAILVPLPESANNHQRLNAFEYAKAGAALVIEEDNFTPHLVLREVTSILANEGVRTAMHAAAQAFYKPDAAKEIALEVLRLAGFTAQ